MLVKVHLLAPVCSSFDHQQAVCRQMGRFLNIRGEKAGLVHLDGGALQDPLASELPSILSPPAYAE